MQRDIANIKRDLENKKNNDIIWKKEKLKIMFKEDELKEKWNKIMNKNLYPPFEMGAEAKP